MERSVWRRHEKGTKTDDPRLVVVVEPLAEILATQRRWLIATQHEGLLSGLVYPASEIHARTGAARRAVDEPSWFRAPEVLYKPLRKVWDEGKDKLPEFSAHALRRTFATLALKAGMNPLHLQGLLGHSSLEMTRRYVQMMDEDLVEAHRLYGPVDHALKK